MSHACIAKREREGGRKEERERRETECERDGKKEKGEGMEGERVRGREERELGKKMGVEDVERNTTNEKH